MQAEAVDGHRGEVVEAGGGGREVEGVGEVGHAGLVDAVQVELHFADGGAAGRGGCGGDGIADAHPDHGVVGRRRGDRHRGRRIGRKVDRGRVGAERGAEEGRCGVGEVDSHRPGRDLEVVGIGRRRPVKDVGELAERGRIGVVGGDTDERAAGVELDAVVGHVGAREGRLGPQLHHSSGHRVGQSRGRQREHLDRRQGLHRQGRTQHRGGAGAHIGVRRAGVVGRPGHAEERRGGDVDRSKLVGRAVNIVGPVFDPAVGGVDRAQTRGGNDREGHRVGGQKRRVGARHGRGVEVKLAAQHVVGIADRLRQQVDRGQRVGHRVVDGHGDRC